MRLILLGLLVSLVFGANLLQNPSFESGSGAPSSWYQYGSGSFNWLQGTAHMGKRSVSLGGSSLAEYYQRVGITAGNLYQVSAWVKSSSSTGSGVVKIEFQNSNGDKLNETSVPFSIKSTDPWQQILVNNTAPSGSTQSTASIVANEGSTIIFDDVSLDHLVTPTLPFDLKNLLKYSFMGFGAMIWADMNYGYNEFQALNIKWIRTTQDSTTVDQMRTMRSVTDKLGIQQLYVLWQAPSQFVNSSDMLVDVSGFANYWVNLVANLSAEGVCPHAIDLMNECDSGGQWSTGITPSDFNSLVKQVRSGLNSRGFQNVSIYGPGMSNLGYNHNTEWIGALDSTAVSALEKWASHAWDDQPGMPGASTMVSVFPQYSDAANAKDPVKPKFITEYATHNTVYNGYTYPDADQTGGYSVASTVPYAVRVIENTLAMLNEGAVSLYYWEAEDQPSKSWGYVDKSGNKKPVYYALLSFYPKLAVGASIVVSPQQFANDIYVSVSVHGTYTLVALSNGGTIAESVIINLSNGPTNLQFLKGTAMIVKEFGNVSQSVPDTATLVDTKISLNNLGNGAYSFTATLPAFSTLVVELDV